VVRLLQLAVRVRLPRDRVTAVLRRLLAAGRPGLPSRRFLSALLDAARPARWLRPPPPPLGAVHTIRSACESGWAATAGFGGDDVAVATAPAGYRAEKVGTDRILVRAHLGTGSRPGPGVRVEARRAGWATAESEHNYADNMNYRGTIRLEGARGLRIEFDPKCNTESGCAESDPARGAMRGTSSKLPIVKAICVTSSSTSKSAIFWVIVLAEMRGARGKMRQAARGQERRAGCARAGCGQAGGRRDAASDAGAGQGRRPDGQA
jgi:hypothetical protein